MLDNSAIYIGHNAVQRLLEFCRELDSASLSLVSDTNTYSALGELVHTHLRQAGFEVTNIVLSGKEIVADEHFVMQVLTQTPPGDQTYIAVGSGTITDITRYVSFRTRNPFISVPTAPSVDGFLSTGAPLVINGVKETYPAQAPIAVFSDVQVLMNAPRELRAAGFGDVLGKTTALADWNLGHLLWKEPYRREAEQRTRRALDSCIGAVAEIASGSERGVHLLMSALLETGISMFEAGDSRPASGSEHHCSHFWEMQLLRENRPAILHGAKVGYATVLISKMYDHIRQVSQADAKDLLADSDFSEPEAEIEEIEQAYGPAAPEVIRIQASFLNMSRQDHKRLKGHIVESWNSIQAIAKQVIPSQVVVELLRQAGAPTNWQELGLDQNMVEAAIRYGHYLRNRFTVVKLVRILGLDAASLVSGE